VRSPPELELPLELDVLPPELAGALAVELVPELELLPVLVVAVAVVPPVFAV